MTQLEIDILIDNCIKNDRKSQKQFYLFTADKLMNVSRRYTKNIADAKDVLQNAYIKIFKNLKTFDKQKGNIDSWLTKIVINEALMMMRKKQNVLIKSEVLESHHEEIHSPEVIARLQAEDLMKILKLLPDGYCVIFNMNVIEGYSHKEIAIKLNITESTSRSQLTRAKYMLRELLSNQKKAELC